MYNVNDVNLLFMDNNYKETTVFIFGGKFASKISFEILKRQGYSDFIVADVSLKNKFYPGKYLFLNDKKKILSNLKTKKRKVFVLATASMTAKKSWMTVFSLEKKYIINVVSCENVVNNAKKIGIGNLIWSGVTLDFDCQIGSFNFINNSSLILHDSIIGNHNFIGPNTTLLGNVVVGNNCFIGSNAVIDKNIKISSNSVIGANSFINKNVTAGTKVFGTPGKVLC